MAEPATLTRDQIIDWCREHIAEILDLPVERIPRDAEFDSFGLDSAASVSMIIDLEDWLGFEVSPSLLFEFPTVQLLANEIIRQQDAALPKVAN